MKYHCTWLQRLHCDQLDTTDQSHPRKTSNQSGFPHFQYTGELSGISLSPSCSRLGTDCPLLPPHLHQRNNGRKINYHNNYDAVNETLIIIPPILRETNFHEFHCLSAVHKSWVHAGKQPRFPNILPAAKQLLIRDLASSFLYKHIWAEVQWCAILWEYVGMYVPGPV